MSAPRVKQRTTSMTPRRATRIQRSSTSSSASNMSLASTAVSLTNSNSRDSLKECLADYSPASDALSLTEETDVDEGEDGDEEQGMEELDEECDFEPKPGDAVWVKSKDTERETWYHGLVQKSTRSGTVRGGRQGIFYSVRYHRNLRRYFAPLLGDIKPDTPRVRRLLEQAGCDLEL